MPPGVSEKIGQLNGSASDGKLRFRDCAKRKTLWGGCLSLLIAFAREGANKDSS